MFFRKNKELMPHERNGCSHNWVHYAGKQCEWDTPSFEEVIQGKKYRKDSNNMCYFYICTICQEELWSSDKMFDIPHYRVRERRNENVKSRRNRKYESIFQ